MVIRRIHSLNNQIDNSHFFDLLYSIVFLYNIIIHNNWSENIIYKIQYQIFQIYKNIHGTHLEAVIFEARRITHLKNWKNIFFRGWRLYQTELSIFVFYETSKKYEISMNCFRFSNLKMCVSNLAYTITTTWINIWI